MESLMDLKITPARKPKESHARYKTRRAAENAAIENYLKHGRMFWDSNANGTYHVGDITKLANGKHRANRAAAPVSSISAKAARHASMYGTGINSFLRGLVRRAA
jgi:hypothetical protein